MEGGTGNYGRGRPPTDNNNNNTNNSNNPYYTANPNRASLEVIPIREESNSDKLDSSMSASTVSDSEEDLSFLQAVRRYPKIAGYCLALTTSILLWGYDLVVVSSVTGVPAFQRDFGELFEGKYIFPSLWLSLWLAFGPLGSAVGSLAGGWLQDRVGRKYCLMTGSVLSAAAVAVIFVSDMPQGLDPKRGVFLLGKTIQGFAVGFIKIQALTYVSENAPTSLRGSAMALFPTFTLLGQLIGSAVVFVIESDETNRGYHIAFASQWVLSAAPFILSFVLPESPAYLVRKGQEAVRAQDRRRGGAGEDHEHGDAGEIQRGRGDVPELLRPDQPPADGHHHLRQPVAGALRAQPHVERELLPADRRHEFAEEPHVHDPGRRPGHPGQRDQRLGAVAGGAQDADGGHARAGGRALDVDGRVELLVDGPGHPVRGNLDDPGDSGGRGGLLAGRVRDHGGDQRAAAAGAVAGRGRRGAAGLLDPDELRAAVHLQRGRGQPQGQDGLRLRRPLRHRDGDLLVLYPRDEGTERGRDRPHVPPPPPRQGVQAMEGRQRGGR